MYVYCSHFHISFSHFILVFFPSAIVFSLSLLNGLQAWSRCASLIQYDVFEPSTLLIALLFIKVMSGS